MYLTLFPEAQWLRNVYPRRRLPTTSSRSSLSRNSEIYVNFWPWFLIELGARGIQRAGASRYERSDERKWFRNRTRTRRFDTRLGTIDLDVPKLRFGGYVPTLLERRSRSERALVAVVKKRCLLAFDPENGKVFSVARSRIYLEVPVSDLCAELDAKATAFRTRALVKRYVSDARGSL